MARAMKLLLINPNISEGVTEIMAAEVNGFSLLDSAGESTPRYEEAARVGRALNRHADLFGRPTWPPAPVGILINERSYQFCASMVQGGEHLAYSVRGWHRLLPWPDVPEGLARLKRRIIIAPLSNGNVALLTNMAKHAGLPWDVIFGADLFRCYKPDPETYLGACRLLALPPGDVMMVAAHNYDLRSAAELGLQTGFVARPTEYGPGQKTDLVAKGDWTVVAKDFVELAEKLGA